MGIWSSEPSTGTVTVLVILVPSINDYTYLITLLNRNHHYWHAPLGLHSTKCKHQSPEWTILSHINCLIQEEVTGFRVLLNSLHPCNTRAS